MTREDRFSRLVENMYKAALAEGRWISVAGLINDVTSTFGHSLTYVDVGPGGQSDIWLSQFFVDSERREDLRQLYFGDYYKRDEAIPRLAGLRDGELVHKSNLYTDREKRKSAVYAFRTRHRTEDGLFMGIDGLDGTAVVWSYGNSTCRDGWGHDQIKTIKRLAPHIRQFSRVRRAMANACALGASLAQLLENKRLGLIQLDGRGRILEANDRARDALLKRDGLRDDRGTLVALHKGENDELQRLLAQASPPFGDQGTGGSMKITRTGTQAPLVLEIHPVQAMKANHGMRQVRALVLVVDSALRPRLDPDLVVAALGLTPAESRVAVAMASGQTVPGIALALGCAENTVKTHVKRIYRKLGIHKQTELVQRVLSLDAFGTSVG
ncbi:MAG: helix-turn-helix transcriptional regulator [Gemmatimonadetes bacterium]|nr:helix-turn-helix transcriptional regulator [Gemmatimonadota bacterium]MYA42228.1 helix-turn-helix transcriptional regulator [Gemmatimonadota bacterium]MYE95669.1 helix-turn-helix transcriptional regulator [Gemmatimonadota bacterium]MYJ08743.1 helix-turn-helix transcriptional regulator [Gemmatimonadota bacterium]